MFYMIINQYFALLSAGLAVFDIICYFCKINDD